MYLIKFGEIFLKGKNKSFFEKKLIKNMKSLLNLESDDIVKFSGQLLIKKDNITNLKYIFGISNYAEVIECDFKDINKTALLLTENEETFRITASRSTKEYKPSNEIEKEVGAFIVEQRGLRVNLKNPELTIYIDIINGKAYLNNKKIKGLGGLPVGAEGSVYIKVIDEKLSFVAAYLMMKRGCNVILSKELKSLNKFQSSIKIREKKDNDILISTDLVPKEQKDPSFTLYPLLGFTEEEINLIFKSFH